MSSNTQYTPLTEKDTGEHESKAFLADSESDESASSYQDDSTITARAVLLSPVPWMISTAVLGALSFFLILQTLLASPSPSPSPSPSYETRFKTDLKTPIVPLKEVVFRGGDQFYDNGTAYLLPPDENAAWPENETYIGEPSPEIDRAWDKLLQGRYFSISEEEAIEAWGDNRHVYRDKKLGGYTAGLEMFHTLHCIDALRKGIHQDYYPLTHLHGARHLEHCLEVVRQVAMCYGSTTLIPTSFRKGIRQNYIDSDQKHTCRDFNTLRDYVSSRAIGGSRYVRRNPW